MEPLELASLDDLINELQTRCPNGLIVLETAGSERSPKGEITMKPWGSPIWMLGAKRWIEQSLHVGGPVHFGQIVSLDDEEEAEETEGDED